MIDIDKAKNAFSNYVENYDVSNDKIKLKVDHSIRTAKCSKDLAISLKLDKENIELAELIGLLHDIGRFEQLKVYNTFLDKNSINHGEYGVKILFQDGLIRKFIEDKKYDEIIKKAILNHNRGKIEDGLSKEELLHAKIIRDADKIDIFYVILISDFSTLFNSEDISNEEITEEIYREFIEDKKINYSNIKTNIDKVLAHFAYCYDFNFKYSLTNFLNNNYLEKYYKRFSFNNSITQQKFDICYKQVIEYIKSFK